MARRCCRDVRVVRVGPCRRRRHVRWCAAFRGQPHGSVGECAAAVGGVRAAESTSAERSVEWRQRNHGRYGGGDRREWQHDKCGRCDTEQAGRSSCCRATGRTADASTATADLCLDDQESDAQQRNRTAQHDRRRHHSGARDEAACACCRTCQTRSAEGRRRARYPADARTATGRTARGTARCSEHSDGTGDEVSSESNGRGTAGWRGCSSRQLDLLQWRRYRRRLAGFCVRDVRAFEEGRGRRTLKPHALRARLGLSIVPLQRGEPHRHAQMRFRRAVWRSSSVMP